MQKIIMKIKINTLVKQIENVQNQPESLDKQLLLSELTDELQRLRLKLDKF